MKMTRFYNFFITMRIGYNSDGRGHHDFSERITAWTEFTCQFYFSKLASLLISAIDTYLLIAFLRCFS
jgi:hypothetical protein